MNKKMRRTCSLSTYLPGPLPPAVEAPVLDDYGSDYADVVPPQLRSPLCLPNVSWVRVAAAGSLASNDPCGPGPHLDMSLHCQLNEEDLCELKALYEAEVAIEGGRQPAGMLLLLRH